MEKINVAELIKDCPKGMEFDCLLCNNPIELEGVVGEDATYPIRAVGKDGFHHVFTAYGASYNHADAKCVIYPKGKTTWEGFQRPIEDGDIVAFDSKDGAYLFIFKEYIYDHNYAQCYMMLNCNGDIDFESGCYFVERLATKEEKEKLFKAIKEHGYRWNEETKTLEELIKPKFKVGDRIRHISAYASGIVVKVTDKGYHVDYTKGEGVCYINFTLEKDYELVPNKFDINTLVPFESKVLIRDNKSQKWSPAIWGFYDSDVQDYQYKLIGVIARYCIPYEGNEHLLGTTNDCDEFYKTWE